MENKENHVNNISLGQFGIIPMLSSVKSLSKIKYYGSKVAVLFY